MLAFVLLTENKFLFSVFGNLYSDEKYFQIFCFLKKFSDSDFRISVLDFCFSDLYSGFLIADYRFLSIIISDYRRMSCHKHDKCHLFYFLLCAILSIVNERLTRERASPTCRLFEENCHVYVFW